MENPGVLQVALSLHPGGTERLVLALARGLSAEFRTAVCCLDDLGPWGLQLREAGVDVVSAGRTPGFHPALALRIAQIARERRCTVLHCHHYTPFVYGALARLRDPRMRVIFTEHGRLGDTPPSPKRRFVNRFLRTLPDTVVAVSEDLRQHLTREGFRPGDVRVITNGIAIPEVPTAAHRASARAALNIPPEAFVVGSVGRLDPVKDFPTLIDAFATVQRAAPAARLVIVGDGPERGNLASLVRTAGREPAMVFTGHRDDALSLLAAFDVYANSSVFEGVSLTILEAMAAMLPVVATAVGGTADVVVDGQTGILVAARDAAALAAGLRSFFDDADRRAQYGSAARDRIVARFSLDSMLAAYAELYRTAGSSR